MGRVEEDEPWLEIVGLVRDVRSAALEQGPKPQIYRPFFQETRNDMVNVVRVEGDAGRIAGAVRAAVREIDPAQPVTGLRTMAGVVAESLARRRFSLQLLALFAGAALGLTVVGLYGVISYLVTERTRELGVRLALGARPRDLLGLVVGQGMRLALAGIGLGLVGAAALTRLMSGLLYGVGSISFAACYLPARRVSRLDPMAALREG